MKKIIALFGFITLSTSISFAYINDNATADIDLLKKQGYSRATLEIVDKTTYMHQGENGKYQRRFTPKKHKTKLQNAYTDIKNYIDPAQDDGKFGEHKIEFSNTLMGDETFYSSPLEENQPIENL